MKGKCIYSFQMIEKFDAMIDQMQTIYIGHSVMQSLYIVYQTCEYFWIYNMHLLKADALH